MFVFDTTNLYNPLDMQAEMSSSPSQGAHNVRARAINDYEFFRAYTTELKNCCIWYAGLRIAHLKYDTTTKVITEQTWATNNFSTMYPTGTTLKDNWPMVSSFRMNDSLSKACGSWKFFREKENIIFGFEYDL